MKFVTNVRLLLAAGVGKPSAWGNQATQTSAIWLDLLAKARKSHEERPRWKAVSRLLRLRLSLWVQSLSQSHHHLELLNPACHRDTTLFLFSLFLFSSVLITSKIPSFFLSNSNPFPEGKYLLIQLVPVFLGQSVHPRPPYGQDSEQVPA